MVGLYVRTSCLQYTISTKCLCTEVMKCDKTMKERLIWVQKIFGEAYPDVRSKQKMRKMMVKLSFFGEAYPDPKSKQKMRMMKVKLSFHNKTGAIKSRQLFQTKRLQKPGQKLIQKIYFLTLYCVEHSSLICG